MLTDSTGYAPNWWNKETIFEVSLWINDPFLMWMRDDYNNIQSGEVTFIPNESGGGKIRNSYKVQNPIIIIWYSYELRSEYSDNIKGTAEGVAAEWMLHNALFDVFYLPNKVGLLGGPLEKATHTDIGRTVFHEERWYVTAPTIAIQYAMNRTSVVIDFAIYITTRGGE